ncbi:uroporphyrinogen decarboxylase family protein [Holophaga foetida]|uniref:uroporphyrinogen decarboxylase family protein n=1 Tax=Holophaga foetida TaxID=35839 RepID=UPI000247430F|nr:uroporphyrinogen decarboxylase family protein [Holophaga foetida]
MELLAFLLRGPATRRHPRRGAASFNKQPGKELEDNAPLQYHESEIMTREDYALLRQPNGGMEYTFTFWERAHGVTRPQIFQAFGLIGAHRGEEIQRSLQRGQSLTWGSLGPGAAFEDFSMMRSMDKFFRDVFQMGSELEELLWIQQAANLKAHEISVAQTGIKRVFVPGTRGSSQFINKKNFERFYWPYLQDFLGKLIAMDITPILHFDSDWGGFLEYFLQLPAKKFVLELDSATDIYKAHDVLKGHCAIKGDMPAGLLAVGNPDDVDAYAKKLITTFGQGGGLLYSVGCTMPFNARKANVDAFFNAVEKYGRYN